MSLQERSKCGCTKSCTTCRRFIPVLGFHGDSSISTGAKRILSIHSFWPAKPKPGFAMLSRFAPRPRPRLWSGSTTTPSTGAVTSNFDLVPQIQLFSSVYIYIYTHIYIYICILYIYIYIYSTETCFAKYLVKALCRPACTLTFFCKSHSLVDRETQHLYFRPWLLARAGKDAKQTGGWAILE